ncbi:MAG TPA: hypothetical protein VK689_16195, partial [Armatimonadota bacterium]|nr:hypothetical protein [Armatimonadota bacterium]
LCWLESQYHDAADIFPFRESPSEPRLISKEKSALTPARSEALASFDPSQPRLHLPARRTMRGSEGGVE